MYCEDASGAYSLNFEKFSDDRVSSIVPVNESLILDDEKVEGVKTGVTSSEAKTMAALKSHSEAERKRRERINAHLATLRDLIPQNEKMDKATLLAEVINQVKQLKISATQACKDMHIPLDSDEVKVEIAVDEGKHLIIASLCCEYRHNLMSRIRKAINELGLKVFKCEISTLGGRVKIVLLIINGSNNINMESWDALKLSVHGAFNNILRSISESAEFDQQLIYPQKRRRFLIGRLYVDIY